MLVSFPSMGSGLNANAKEFVPSTTGSPSGLEQKAGESPNFRPHAEPVASKSTFSSKKSTPTIPVKRKHSGSAPTVFEHPTVTPIPQYEPQYFPTDFSAQQLTVQQLQLPSPHQSPPHSSSTSPVHTPISASSSRYLPASSFAGASHQSRVHSSRHRGHSSRAAGHRARTLKKEVHSLLSQWHVRPGCKGRLLVLRGLPGTGKSKIASLLESHAVTCSADRFFSMHGLDTFDPSRTKEALKACKQDFYAALSSQQSLIILDNINAELRNYQHEVHAARRLGYSVRIWELQPRSADDFWAAWRRNTHGVTEHQFLAAYNHWEPDPHAYTIPVHFA